MLLLLVAICVVVFFQLVAMTCAGVNLLVVIAVDGGRRRGWQLDKR